MEAGVAVSESPPLSRNPGPRWGFWFLQTADRWLPRWLFRGLLMAGTWVAVALLPQQRHHSRAFLTEALGRPARTTDVWRHFFAFLDLLMLRLRIAGGAAPRCELAPENAGDFERLMASGAPALFGTFHFGHSDLLGFLLSTQGRRVAMVRLRVANSADTAMLEAQFGRAVSFIWVNEPESLLFALKSAIEAGHSLAMQCDRMEFTAKTEAFQFFGAARLFPFTIYHLAILFGRPVMFCLGLPERDGGTCVLASPLFTPEPGFGREENFQRARLHFQAVLARLETLVRQHPQLWFNFLPLNPRVQPAAAGAR
jgi:predicted LPLAT superfamily acyltransferase